MIVIGVTGQSGSGKSIASNVFLKRGIRVIDADRIARDVVKVGTETNSEMRKAFGDSYFLQNGELNRKKLGETVFSDKSKLALLNSIIHPAICSIIEREISTEKDKFSARAIVIDAPLLKQVGLNKLCDIVITIAADEDIRLKRIMDRDNLTFEIAKNRLLLQDDEKFYTEGSTKIFKNNLTEDELEDQVNKYADELGL